jgi:hypothetical protein
MKCLIASSSLRETCTAKAANFGLTPTFDLLSPESDSSTNAIVMTNHDP